MRSGGEQSGSSVNLGDSRHFPALARTGARRCPVPAISARLADNRATSGHVGLLRAWGRDALVGCPRRKVLFFPGPRNMRPPDAPTLHRNVTPPPLDANECSVSGDNRT